jgi:transcriptional regulator with XRE-family HTH domain
MRLSKNIKHLRKSKGLTQAQFAEALGPDFAITKASIASYETDRNEPPVRILIRMAEVFGVTLPDLLYHNYEKDGDTRVLPNEKEQYNQMREIVDRLKGSAVSMEWLKQHDHTSFVLLGGRD